MEKLRLQEVAFVLKMKSSISKEIVDVDVDVDADVVQKLFPFYCHSSLFSGSHYLRFLSFSLVCMNREKQDDHYCAPSDGMQSVSCCGSVFLEILVSVLSPVFSGVSRVLRLRFPSFMSAPELYPWLCCCVSNCQWFHSQGSCEDVFL